MKIKALLILSALILGACQTTQIAEKKAPKELSRAQCPVDLYDRASSPITFTDCFSRLTQNNSNYWYTTSWEFNDNNLDWAEIYYEKLPLNYYWTEDTRINLNGIRSWNQLKETDPSTVQTFPCPDGFGCLSFEHPTDKINCFFFGNMDKRGIKGANAGSRPRLDGYHCSPQLNSSNIETEARELISSIIIR